MQVTVVNTSTEAAADPSTDTRTDTSADHTLDRLARALTAQPCPPAGHIALRRFADIDDGLVVRINQATVQLMPHGGRRVVERLAEWLTTHGVPRATDPPATDLYPEADSPIEAEALLAISRAPSPAAVDALAAQPDAWRAWYHNPHAKNPPPDPDTNTNPRRPYPTPPTLALIGPANVGKSTLTNAMLGREASIVADLPGTTRDWVGGTLTLPSPAGGLAVRWIDTPGLRLPDHTPTQTPANAIERRAIAAAAPILQAADLLIAVTDPDHHHPHPHPHPDPDHHQRLPRRPDLYVLNKIDNPQPCTDPGTGQGPEADASTTSSAGSTPDHPLRLSAKFGHGLAALEAAILTVLGCGPNAPSPDTPWRFNPTLHHLTRQSPTAQPSPQLAHYLGLNHPPSLP